MRVAATAPLLERSDELARIEAALAAARSGRGTFLLVEGPAGYGKTALLAAARAPAAESAMSVLRSRGTELERDFAFGVVRQLFEPVLAEIAEPQRVELLHGAAGVAADLLGLPGASEPDLARSSGFDSSFAILHGLYWLSANLAASKPLCLFVDDAHWVDAPSLHFLAFLLTRLEELNVALVVATRPREAGTDPEVLAALTAASSADIVRLQPLSRAAVADLVESSLPGTPETVFVDACLQATGGTPFLVHELIAALREKGTRPTAASATEVERIGAGSIGRTTELRLRRLPESASRLARAVAVLEESPVLQAAQLAELGEAEAAEAAELLVEAGILEPGLPLRFVHPIVRAGVHAELSGAERAHAHGRAARVLAELPGTEERVARHLLASPPGADGRVAERLVEAARVARRQGAPELEAAYLRRALQEPPAAERQPRLLLDLGMAEASAGVEGWDAHLRQAMDTAPPGEDAAFAASALAHALNRAQQFSEAVDVLDRAAAALEPRDAGLALQLEAAAVVIGMNDLALSPSMAGRRRQLLARARDDPEAPPDVLGAAAFVSVLENEPARTGARFALLASQQLAGAASRAPLTPSFGLYARMTLSLLWAERYRELEPLLEASFARARAVGDSGLLAVGLANRSWLALRRGDLGATEVDARAALAARELPAPPMYRILNRNLLVLVLVERGELAAAEEELEPLGPEPERGSLIGAMARFARARLRMEQGMPREALADFLAVGGVLGTGNVLSPSFLPWRSQAALAHLALGDSEHARHLAQEEVELASAFGALRALGVAKRAAGIVFGGDRGETLLREAIDAFTAGDASLERARALADLGASLRRRNRRAQARELLREALDGAHRLGASRLAERAETELRATGARPRRVTLTGLDSLTASERRVAQLAGEGLTNREIGQMLFITARTVEGHLTNVFRKLRLDSREELPAALAGGSPVAV